MQEIELKFLVPEAKLRGLMRQVSVKSSQMTHMEAHYYDTTEHDLAKSGIGLRIRKEGNNWVQTIKAGGDGIAARLEHNTRLNHEQVQSMLAADHLMPDISIYKETPIEPALAEFNLKKLAKKLTRHYVTDIQRTTRILENDDSSIEIAYDIGTIIDGNDHNVRSAVQEIEFELIRGEINFLFEIAKVWCKRYKLCLSTVTKAERGGLLIKGQDHSPAVEADLARLHINDDISMPAFVRAVVHNCLLQILPNSSAIVAGSLDNRHVMQLYIGIRRLHTALKACKKFSAQISPAWLSIIEQTAVLLSDYQKPAYLYSHIEPQLRQQGAPSIDWTAKLNAIKVMPIDAVSANDFQLALVELIEFTMNDSSTEPKSDKLAIKKLTKELAKQHSKLLKAECKVAELGEVDSDNCVNNPTPNPTQALYQAQCNLHIQLERLQYLSEFAAPLYANKKSKRWNKRVAKANQSLAEYLDDVQYYQYYQQQALSNTNALYGVGWFAATLKTDYKRCKKRLAKVQDSAEFW